jgi:hypothetical protein
VGQLDRPAAAGLDDSGLASDEYPYNDELLPDETDRLSVQRLYPNIHPALDFPELRTRFLAVDQETTRSKRRSRAWGFVAVALVAVSLLAASGERLYEASPLRPTVALLAAAAGVGGVAVGLFGVLFAGSKDRWLRGRLIAERLRQLHFQIVVAMAGDIIRAARTGRWGDYRAKREAALEAFNGDIPPRAGSMLDRIAGEDEGSAQGAWLVDPGQPPNLTSEPHADEFFRAYRRLRLQRQIDFCDLKLRTDSRLLTDAPREQARRLANATLICIVGLLVLDAVLIVGLIARPGAGQDGLLHVVIVWLAIVVLALRTLTEGLQPEREVERYRQYRSALSAIAARFDRASDHAERRSAMMALEELSFDEMVNFLKCHHEAKFVM